MKARVTENDYYLHIELSPETKEEILQLLRYSNNAKKEKPSIHFHFNDTAICCITLNKKAISVQSNSISTY